MDNDLISRAALGISRCNPDAFNNRAYGEGWNACIAIIEAAPAVDAAPVRRGKWDLLVAKQGEFEWAADACCSLCDFTKRKIWRGYFPVETAEFARGTTTHYAKKVKLPNYCEQCGADLRGEENEVD